MSKLCHLSIFKSMRGLEAEITSPAHLCDQVRVICGAPSGPNELFQLLGSKVCKMISCVDFQTDTWPRG